MSQQSRVTIVAELKDKFTGPSKKMRQELERSGQAVEKANARVAKAAEKAAIAQARSAAKGGHAMAVQARDVKAASSRIDQSLDQVTRATEKVDKAIAQTGQRWDSELTGMASEANQAEDKIDRALGRAGVNGGRRMVENIRSAGGRFVREAASIGKRAGDKIAEGIEAALEKIDSSPVAGIVGTGTVVGGVASSLSRDAQTRAWAAAEGVDLEAGRALTDQVYAQGMGEDYTQALGAAGAVVSSYELEPGSPEAKRLLEDNLTLAAAFGLDPAKLAMSAKILADVDGSSLVQAQDIFASALQNAPTHSRDEVLDAMNEYGAVLEGTGISAGALGHLLSESADSGNWAVDKQGDALKEFAVRTLDTGSKPIGEAYAALGLNQSDVSARLQAGDMSVLNDTATALLAVDDTAERAALALEVFGVPLEDLGPAQIEEQLRVWSDLETQIADTTGTVDRMQEVMSEGPGRDWTELLRAMEESLIAVGDAAAPVLIPLFDMLTMFAPVLGPLAAAFGGLWAAAGAYKFVTGALGFLGMAGDKAKGVGGKMRGLSGAAGKATTSFGGLGGVLRAHPLLALAGIVYGAVEAFGFLYENSEDVRRVVDGIVGVFDTLDTKIQNVGRSIEELIRDKFPALNGAMDTMESNTAGMAGGKVQDAVNEGGVFGGNPVFKYIQNATPIGSWLDSNMPWRADDAEAVPAHADGGFTRGDGIYRAGERGREFIVPASATNSIEASAPGALATMATTGSLPQSGLVINQTLNVPAGADARTARSFAAEWRAQMESWARDHGHTYGTMAARGAR